MHRRAPFVELGTQFLDHVTVLLGEVTDIDLEQRRVTSHVLGRETVSEYDSLIVAAGAGQSYFGNDHFAEFAPGMKSIDDALELRGRTPGRLRRSLENPSELLSASTVWGMNTFYKIDLR